VFYIKLSHFSYLATILRLLAWLLLVAPSLDRADQSWFCCEQSPWSQWHLHVKALYTRNVLLAALFSSFIFGSFQLAHNCCNLNTKIFSVRRLLLFLRRSCTEFAVALEFCLRGKNIYNYLGTWSWNLNEGKKPLSGLSLYV
jgi:hypothetical protein